MNKTTGTNLTKVGAHLLYFNMTGFEQFPQYNPDDDSYHVHLTFEGTIGEERYEKNFDFTIGYDKPDFSEYYTIAKNIVEIITPSYFKENILYNNEATLAVTFDNEIIAIKKTNQNKFLIFHNTSTMCTISDESDVLEYIKYKKAKLIKEKLATCIQKLTDKQQSSDSYSYEKISEILKLIEELN